MLALRTTEGRSVGLLVGSVVGLYGADTLRLADAPPLLRDSDSDRVAALGRLDEALLTVLRLGNLVPDDVWHRIQEGAA